MRVYPVVNSEKDQPFWIKKSVFYERFDQADFLNRNVERVCQVYLSDWFYLEDEGRRMFFIPVVGALGGRTDMIGTRHRLAVILPHMDELPIAFATGHLDNDAQVFLNSIPRRPLDLSEAFSLPDFPIVDRLP
jgi:hypothetical protein